MFDQAQEMTEERKEEFTTEEIVEIYDYVVNRADKGEKWKDDPEFRLVARYGMLMCLNDRRATEVIVKRMKPEERASVRKATEEFRSGLIKLRSGEKETDLTPESSTEIIQIAEMILSVFDSCIDCETGGSW